MSLEQYYTEEVIGERLVAMLPCSAPETCIELSAGKGALLTPIIKKWPNIRISTCELDPQNNRFLKNNFAGKHHELDVISSTFDRTFKKKYSRFDLAVCNPPFSWRINSEYEKSALKDFGVEWMRDWSKVRSEIIFIIQNLKLLKNTGYLAIILPELIVFSDTFSKFREHLSALTSVISISEVETGSFKGTEARTYILVLSKNRFNTPFSLTNSDQQTSMHSQNEFYSWSSKTSKNPLFSLAESTFELKRGKHSGKTLRHSNIAHYHTTGFFNGKEPDAVYASAQDRVVQETNPLVASTGHVLINRVGTRALGKAVVVERGSYIVSDCAFRLALPDDINPYEVVTFWHQQAEVIIQNARGTCAQYITKNDIINHLAFFLQVKSAGNSTSSNLAIA